ncbi:unnamed protein product, partial [Adineta steineri]
MRKMYIDPVWRRYWQWYFLLNAIILFDLIVSVHGQIDTATSSSRSNVSPIRRRKPLTTSTRRPIATGGSSAPDCDHGGCYPATGDL